MSPEWALKLIEDTYCRIDKRWVLVARRGEHLKPACCWPGPTNEAQEKKVIANRPATRVVPVFLETYDFRNRILRTSLQRAGIKTSFFSKSSARKMILRLVVKWRDPFGQQMGSNSNAIESGPRIWPCERHSYICMNGKKISCNIIG